MSKTVSEPRVVLLVPFSSKDPSRIKIWNHTHSWLKQTLNYPLYIGEHFPKDFSKYNLSLARNLAAQKAGDWDVAVIHDADTVINPKHIKAGVKTALETGAVTYPYTQRWELDFTGTKMLLENEHSDWQSHMTKHTRNQPLGGCIIVRRDLWDLVRGFDTGFVGWGHEDGAFAIACEVLSGKKLRRITGNSLHLEHVFAPAKKPDNPIYQANKRRIKSYMESMVKTNARGLIRDLRQESLPTDKSAGIKWPKVKNGVAKMDQTVALILLADVTSVLEKYGCTYWLSDGTLLGAIRENGFIKHDDDLDLGVWAASFDKRVIHELISRFSCNINRLQGKQSDGMVITVGRAGIHLDMFFYYPIKNLEGTLKGNKTDIYSCLYSLVRPYNTSNKAKRYNCVFPNYKPLVRRDFLGHKFWVPKNAEAHLAAAYGLDWRKPKKDWVLFEDQENLKQQGIVDDMRADKLAIEKYLGIEPARK